MHRPRLLRWSLQSDDSSGTNDQSPLIILHTSNYRIPASLQNKLFSGNSSSRGLEKYFLCFENDLIPGIKGTNVPSFAHLPNSEFTEEEGDALGDRVSVEEHRHMRLACTDATVGSQ